MKALQMTASLVALVLLSGCASPRAYLTDRGHDALDVLTCAVGLGAGAKVRAGPLHAGLLMSRDFAGLRGGQMGWWGSDGGGELDPFLIPCSIFGFGCEMFSLDSVCDAGRGKEYDALSYVPFFYTYLKLEEERTSAIWRREWPQYTELEGVIGLGPTLRLGINPGELLDFLIGWIGFDIYNDDVATEWRHRSK